MMGGLHLEGGCGMYRKTYLRARQACFQRRSRPCDPYLAGSRRRQELRGRAAGGRSSLWACFGGGPW